MRALFLLTLLWGQFSLFSQDRCATPDLPEERLQRFETWIHNKQNQKRQSPINRTADIVYTIPVVVHIIHKGEAIGTGYNIPTQRVLEQIEILNQDFRKSNPRAANVPTVFQPVEADIEVEFVLARQTPEGNPTTGIVRKQGSRSNYNYPSHETILKAESYWSSDDYLNIWVADVSVLGWASFPVSNEFSDINDPETNPLLDGVVIDAMYMGINPNTGGTFESFGQTATHEIGHYLGLHHIWGTCMTNDYCTDTPAANANNGGLGDPCTFPGPDSCTTDALPDMFMNYMDYSNDECMNMFTTDQRFRMRTVLENSPRRTSLLSSPGLNYPIGAFSLDLAIVSVEELPLVLCPTEVNPVLIFGNYGNDEISSFELSYKVNGIQSVENISGLTLAIGELHQVTIPSQTLSNQTNTFEFAITQVNGSPDDNELNDLLEQVVIINDVETESPFREGFTNQGDWIITSTDGSTEWEFANEKMLVSAHGLANDLESWLISPIFSLEGFDQAGMFFKLAYSLTDETDLMQVRVADGCTGNFQLLSTVDLAQLDFPISDEPLLDPDENDWKELFVNLNAYVGEPEIRLAFVFTNMGGNNLYLDDVEIVNNSNPNQPRIKNGRFIVYPNPSTNYFRITFNLPETQPIRVQLIDVSGKVVLDNQYPAVLNQTYDVDTGNYFGTYFLRALGANIDQTQRILISR